MASDAPATGLSLGYASCHVCYKLTDAREKHCGRCGSHLHARQPQSIERATALLITAIILYVPANVLPIMFTDALGNSSGSTIMGGVVLLWHMGSYPVASVIFIASVMVPLAKIMALGVLIWSVARKQELRARQRTTLYRITEFVGRWSMIDVFVISILVALIHLTGLLVIRPGPAALAFAGVVIVTMIAAESFDSRLIWDSSGDTRERN